MRLILTQTQQTALANAAAAERGVWGWKRYQAVLLLAEGQAPASVARTPRCSLASVCNWATVWRRSGAAGLREGDHGGGRPKLGPAGEAVLGALLTEDPQARGHQATGWTVPLLRTGLASAGCAVSAKTVRRALHRQGCRWKRPRDILGRPDPDSAEKREP